MGRPVVKIAVGLLVTFFSVYLFYLSVGDLKSVAVALHQISFCVICGSAALSLLALFFRALRLKIMLDGRSGVGVKSLFSIISVSFMFNNVLPFRMGEVARVYLVYRKYECPLTLSLGSLFAERVLDSLGYAFLLVVPAYMLGFFSTETSLLGVVPLRPVLIAVSLGLFLGVIFVSLMALRPSLVSNLLTLRPFRRWAVAVRIMEWIEEMVKESIVWLSSPAKLIKVFLLTLATVLCYGLTIYILVFAVDSKYDLIGSLFASGIVAIGVSLPSAPGYAGTLELALQSGLLLLNLAREKAAAVAVSYHLIGWVAVVVTGLFCWLKMDIPYSFLQLQKKENAA